MCYFGGFTKVSGFSNAMLAAGCWDAGSGEELGRVGMTVTNVRSEKHLTRIFHSETGKTMANPCSAGFPACRIASPEPFRQG
jgi:hypothetical protein